jgi:hypothetical protein
MRRLVFFFLSQAAIALPAQISAIAVNRIPLPADYPDVERRKPGTYNDETSAHPVDG